MRKLIILAGVLAVALAACGGGDTGAPTGPVSVAEVPSSPTEGPLTVRGFLFVDADGNAELCDLILESYPPQCGGDRITVEGNLPLDQLTADQGRSWTNAPVDLTGSWDGTTLTVA